MPKLSRLAVTVHLIGLAGHAVRALSAYLNVRLKKPTMQIALEYVRAIDSADLDISSWVDSVAPQLGMELNLTGMGSTNDETS